MSHWAELDSNNKVIRVTVGDNNQADEGYQWLIDNLGGTWVKTSYNGKIRTRFAGIGMIYREDLDAFIAPQCHEEAILNETTIEWECENNEHIITIS
jgi:hypothetical protein